MASSRSSSASGRGPARRTGAAKPPPRKRTGSSHKAAPAKKPAAKKAGPKAKPKPRPAPKAKPRRAPKPKPVRAKAPGPKTAAVSRRSKPSPLTVALVAGALVLGLAAAYLFWFKDSSLVGVEKVTVDGIDGPEEAQVTDALTRAGQGMTTLNVDETELAAAVSGFPTVVAIDTETDFPHGLTVHVTGRPPVLNASDGGPPVPVAGDGTLLRGVDTSEADLPALQVDSLPVKGKLEGQPLALAQVAGAAPEPLRPFIKGLAVNEGDGIEVTLKGRIPVKFGDPGEAERKWDAVAAILANPQVKTLTHLDVRVPDRPSVGGAAPEPTPEEETG